MKLENTALSKKEKLQCDSKGEKLHNVAELTDPLSVQTAPLCWLKSGMMSCFHVCLLTSYVS